MKLLYVKGTLLIEMLKSMGARMKLLRLGFWKILNLDFIATFKLEQVLNLTEIFVEPKNVCRFNFNYCGLKKILKNIDPRTGNPERMFFE